MTVAEEDGSSEMLLLDITQLLDITHRISASDWKSAEEESWPHMVSPCLMLNVKQMRVPKKLQREDESQRDCGCLSGCLHHVSYKFLYSSRI